MLRGSRLRLVNWGMLSIFGTGLWVEWQKAIVGLGPIFFGPCTLGRTWGTRPDFLRPLLRKRPLGCGTIWRTVMGAGGRCNYEK
jgi:hypothetical protein